MKNFIQNFSIFQILTLSYLLLLLACFVLSQHPAIEELLGMKKECLNCINIGIRCLNRHSDCNTPAWMNTSRGTLELCAPFINNTCPVCKPSVIDDSPSSSFKLTQPICPTPVCPSCPELSSSKSLKTKITIKDCAGFVNITCPRFLLDYPDNCSCNCTDKINSKVKMALSTSKPNCSGVRASALEYHDKYMTCLDDLESKYINFSLCLLFFIYMSSRKFYSSIFNLIFFSSFYSSS